jgi:hypothetical protein
MRITAMYTQTAQSRISKLPFAFPFSALEVTTEVFSNEDENQVFEFLAQRPLHTVGLVGLIRDNGLVNPLNRGQFYGCRNRKGELEGVALIGHATLMETRTTRALQAFAEIAQKCTAAHMIMGEQDRIQEFWNYYSDHGQEMRSACRELLFELRWPLEVHDQAPGLRPATLDNLDLIVPVHAQMAFE